MFATWLGWLTDPTGPLIIVRNDDQDPEEIVWQALKIGHDNLVGELASALTAWTRSGGTLTSTPLIGPEEIGAQVVVDVRQQTEFATGHLPGALHLELGDVAARAHALPPGPMVIMCGHGERAMSAASLLESAGHRDISVLNGGPEGWAKTTGRDLVTEPARPDTSDRDTGERDTEHPTADPAAGETAPRTRA